MNIPYTHSGIVSSYNAMNKIISKQIFIDNNILTPKFFSLQKNDNKDYKIKILLKKNRINFPLVIKPINEGSSLGVKIVKSFSVLKKTIKVL